MAVLSSCRFFGVNTVVEGSGVGAFGWDWVYAKGVRESGGVGGGGRHDKAVGLHYMYV